MIKWLFSVPPVIGSRWRWRVGSRDPFETMYVRVVDVKRRYVQYAVYASSTSTSFWLNSRSIRDFRMGFTELR